ncbi:MAG TPA: hypothetical protein VJH23_00545 [archaeon]|nr:hypothetical protein [archaeon]
MNPKGQASLEFMILLAALLGFLSVSVSAFSGLHDSAIAAIDAQNAKAFANNITSKAALLTSLGDSSSQSVSSDIFGEWEISGLSVNASGGCRISVHAAPERIVSFPLPENVACNLSKSTFTKKITLHIRKSGGKISLSD